MTNLQKLEADIRQKLPRLMELTEGCLFNFKLMDKTTSKTFKVQWIEGDIINANNGYCRVISSSVNVIGHDPNLNDVLEWLGIEYMINGKGTICKWSDDEYRYIPQDNWNLSEPLLKNQDQSVINYLAGLI